MEKTDVKTLKQLLNQAEIQLSLERVSESARLDAEVLLAFTLKQPRSFLFAHAEEVIDHDDLLIFIKLLNRRLQGEPIAYICGRQEFWSLDLKVTPDVLIPRPETELLVELVLAEYTNKEPIQLVDAGTGSGAIALAVATERPNWSILGLDFSQKALDLASENARNLDLNHQVRLCRSNWCSAIQAQSIDVLVTNPPYIDESDEHLNCGDVRFEPLSALVAPDQGLLDIQCLVEQGARVLKPGGCILIEHGWKQSSQVLELLSGAGFVDCHSVKDFAGNERVSRARRI